MGQNRNDTGPQRAAKRRTADRNRCPKCGRGGAIVRDSEAWDEPDGTTVLLTFLSCRWRDRRLCDYQQTIDSRTQGKA